MNKEQFWVFQGEYFKYFRLLAEKTQKPELLDHIYLTWEQYLALYPTNGSVISFYPEKVYYTLEGVDASSIIEPRTFVSAGRSSTHFYFSRDFQDEDTLHIDLDNEACTSAWVKPVSADTLEVELEWSKDLAEKEVLRQVWNEIAKYLSLRGGNLVRNRVEFDSGCCSDYFRFFYDTAKNDWKLYLAERGIDAPLGLSSWIYDRGYLSLEIPGWTELEPPKYLDEFLPWLKTRRLERQRVLFAAKRENSSVFRVLKEEN